MKHITEKEFIDFVIDDLPPDEEARIEAHVEQCPRCTKKVLEFFEPTHKLPAKLVTKVGRAVHERDVVKGEFDKQ